MPHLELYSYIHMYQWWFLGFMVLLIWSSSKLFPRLIALEIRLQWVKTK